jgi:hypothetical protein
MITTLDLSTLLHQSSTSPECRTPAMPRKFPISPLHVLSNCFQYHPQCTQLTTSAASSRALSENLRLRHSRIHLMFTDTTRTDMTRKRTRAFKTATSSPPPRLTHPPPSVPRYLSTWRTFDSLIRRSSHYLLSFAMRSMNTLLTRPPALCSSSSIAASSSRPRTVRWRQRPIHCDESVA